MRTRSLIIVPALLMSFAGSAFAGGSTIFAQGELRGGALKSPRTIRVVTPGQSDAANATRSRASTVVLPSGKQVSSSSSMTRGGGSIHRAGTMTLPGGKTASRESDLSKTENGAIRISSTTGPGGQTTSGMTTWTREGNSSAQEDAGAGKELAPNGGPTREAAERKLNRSQSNRSITKTNSAATAGPMLAGKSPEQPGMITVKANALKQGSTSTKSVKKNR